jgi:hypothetical protein
VAAVLSGSATSLRELYLEHLVERWVAEFEAQTLVEGPNGTLLLSAPRIAVDDGREWAGVEAYSQHAQHVRVQRGLLEAIQSVGIQHLSGGARLRIAEWAESVRAAVRRAEEEGLALGATASLRTESDGKTPWIFKLLEVLDQLVAMLGCQVSE